MDEKMIALTAQLAAGDYLKKPDRQYLIQCLIELDNRRHIDDQFCLSLYLVHKTE